jgi:nicotinamide riboside kinase
MEPGWGQDYHTLAIMGSQSTGKSTLLNALFGSSF